MPSRRKFCLICCAFAAAATGPASAQSTGGNGAESGSQIRAVLELYTSQGCSSCPPADALLMKLAERKDVIALTLPVDYWDYLGWKDTLASPRHSERQRAYAKRRGDGLIYTPQVVVNGLKHANGASRVEIDKAIEATAQRFKSEQVSLKVAMDKGKLVIETGARNLAAPLEATVWLAAVQKSASVTIRKGENHGKQLSYVNVVRELTPVGMWSGKAETIRLERQAVVRPGVEACAVLIQQDTSGPILGAAWLPQW